MCTCPKKGWLIGKTKNGKDEYRITNYGVQFIYLNNNGNWTNAYSPSDSYYPGKIIKDYIEIPCQKCLECRLEKRKEWSNRILMEAKYHSQSSFITLTYDDKYLPHSKYDLDPETGEVTNIGKGSIPSLKREDFTKFIKDLRNYLKYHYDIKVSYFGCGEYGTKSMRLCPHFHLILFGYMPDDLKFYTKNDNGDYIYTSEILEKIWNKGFVTVGEVTGQSAGYVAGYVNKKVSQSYEEAIENLGLVPPMFMASTRPGIGRSYYEANKHNRLFIDSNITVGDEKGAHTFPIPRYFKRLYEQENPEFIKQLKEKQKEIAKDKKKILENSSNISYVHQLKNREVVLEKRTKVLNERSKI